MPVKMLKDKTHLEHKDASASVEKTRQKKKLMQVLDKAAGILNELTDEQKEIFDQTVKRRPLFR